MNLRRRSKRPRTKQAHIPTIPTPAERGRQAALHTTPTGQQTERPAHPPPPFQGRRPARYWRDSTLRTHGQGNSQLTDGLHKGWEDNPPNSPPPRNRDAMTPVLKAGTVQPTNWACTPRGSSTQQQRAQAAGAQRTHRNNGSTTQAAQGRTQK